jgi:hypothetical protein
MHWIRSGLKNSAAALEFNVPIIYIYERKSTIWRSYLTSMFGVFKVFFFGVFKVIISVDLKERNSPIVPSALLKALNE